MSRAKSKLVDTNVILRYLVGDNKKQQQQAKQWFLQAESGELELTVKPLIVAESCFVLESFYELSREKIARAFEVFLSQKWLRVEERESLLNLWPYYRQGLYFVDSFLLATAQNEQTDILSFDKELMEELKH